MLISHISINKRIHTKLLSLTFLTIVISGLFGSAVASASTNVSLYITPSSGTYAINDTIAVNIREDSGTTGLVGVQADLTYNTADLQFVAINTSGSAFPTNGPDNTGGNGSVNIDVFTATPQTGDQDVADVSFKVISTGTTNLNFTGSSQVGYSNGTTGSPATTGASFSLVQPSCPSGQTGTPPNCVNPTCPSGQTGTPPNCVTTINNSTPPATNYSNNTNGNPPASINITPVGSSSSTTVPTNTNFKISAPANISPTPIPNQTIIKTEYFLNNKLLATVNEPPFSYRLDTTNILDGDYTFKTVTYYRSGKRTVASQNILISNPLSFNQIRLAAQKYGLYVVVAIVVLIAIIFLLFHHRFISRLFGGKGNNPPSFPIGSITTMGPSHHPTNTPPANTGGTASAPVNSNPNLTPGSIHKPTNI